MERRNCVLEKEIGGARVTREGLAEIKIQPLFTRTIIELHQVSLALGDGTWYRTYD
jgi:hypothetical protein